MASKKKVPVVIIHEDENPLKPSPSAHKRLREQVYWETIKRMLDPAFEQLKKDLEHFPVLHVPEGSIPRVSQTPIDIEVVELQRPTRRLFWGRRPLSDETLCDFIERVIMRLPEKQRPVLFRSEPVVWMCNLEGVKNLTKTSET